MSRSRGWKVWTKTRGATTCKRMRDLLRAFTKSAASSAAASWNVRAAFGTLGNVVDFAWQDNAEGRAVTRSALILERAAVSFDDAGCDRQTKASAGFLRAEEWVEQSLLDLRWNSFASVGHFKHDHVGLPPTQQG